MNFLVANDDGINAPGIESLARVASDFGNTVVIAPDRQHSASGHRVSGEGVIKLDEIADRKYAISGTPADCTRIGLRHLSEETDWVLAGINEGGNLGCDVFMSGTVAAVREAALMGTKAIALSQYRSGRSSEFDWERAEGWTRLVLPKLLEDTLQPGEFWNVNFPDPPGPVEEPKIVYCPVDVLHYEFDYESHEQGLLNRNSYHQRPRTPGRDIDLCFSGHITISKMTVCSNAPGLDQ